MVSGRVLFMRFSDGELPLLHGFEAWATGDAAAPLRPKYGGLYCGLTGGIQELQEWADAPGPGGFVVLGTFDALVGEIFAELPAFLQKDVAILLDVLNDARAFLRANVKPDSRARLDIRGSGHTVKDALIPPDGRRESGDAAEHSRMLKAEIEREQAAKR